jgi:hypothetical protein
MAKVKLNPIIEQVRGQVGDLVFKRYNDEVVIARKPELDGSNPSAAQLAARERFREAVLYGKMVMGDADTRARYDAAAQAKGQPVFSLVVADFFHAPEIIEVDMTAYSGAVGDPIVVYVADDFEVAEVQMTLTDDGGQAIEAGAATETPPGSGRWMYATTAAVNPGTTVRLTTTAVDRPGNITTGQADRTL